MSAPAPILSKVLEGLDRAEAKLEKAAERIARSPSSPDSPNDEVDLSREAVNLLEARRSYESNLKLMQAADEMREHLIDVLA